MVSNDVSHVAAHSYHHPPTNGHSSPGQSVLDSSVLVLNRFYLAIHVINVKRSLVLLYRSLAEVVDVQDGQYWNYDFDGWRELSEYRTLEIEQEQRLRGRTEPESRSADRDGRGNHRRGSNRNGTDLRHPDHGLLDPSGGTSPSGAARHGASRIEWVQCVHFQLQAPRVVRLYRYDRVPKMSLRFNRRNLFARDDHSCQYCGKSYSSQQLSFDHVVPRSRGGQTCWENVVCCCLGCNTRKGNRTPAEAGMKLIQHPKKPKQNPLLSAKLANPKYDCWRSFLVGASANVEVA